MPQLFRLRVTICLDKLPRRQRNFLLSFAELDLFDTDKFYSHLINHFYFHPNPNSIKNVVGFLGEDKKKQVINFTSEIIVKFLSDQKKADREIYCLTALYEMANFIAYQIYQYNQAFLEKNTILIAQLENVFFGLGLGSYLDTFLKIMTNETFFNDVYIMSASFNTESIKTAMLIGNYAENIANNELNDALAISTNVIDQPETIDEQPHESWDQITIA